VNTVTANAAVYNYDIAHNIAHHVSDAHYSEPSTGNIFWLAISPWSQSLS